MKILAFYEDQGALLIPGNATKAGAAQAREGSANQAKPMPREADRMGKASGRGGQYVRAEQERVWAQLRTSGGAGRALWGL